MFRSISEAEAQIRDHAIGKDDDRVAVLLEALTPALGFQPTAMSEIGGTRLGGVPDLPPDMAWPYREALSPSEIDRLMAPFADYGDAAAENRAWLVRRIPFQFLGQFDLAAAQAAWPADDWPLPSAGRLLVFHDTYGALLPIDPGLSRIIWDQTPVDHLQRAEPPAEFDVLQREKDPDGTCPHFFLHEEKAVAFAPYWHLPEWSANEACGTTPLAELAGDAAFERCYQRLTWPSCFDCPPGEETDRRSRLLGAPSPEQDDPRSDLVAHAGWPYPWHEDEAKMAEGLRRASEWRLLAQFDLFAANANIYFVIRHEDLAQHDFARVHAVFQCT